MAGRIKRRQAAEAGLGSPTASTWLSGFEPGAQRQNRRQGLRQAGRQADAGTDYSAQYGGGIQGYGDYFDTLGRKGLNDYMQGMMGSGASYADRSAAAYAAGNRRDEFADARQEGQSFREQAIAGGWDPEAARNRTGYNTLWDDMAAQQHDMSLSDFQTQKYGASPWDLRQAAREETRNLSDAGFGSGASLAGVRDFDSWAATMRNPRYQEGRDEFLAGPGMEEQLARSSAPAIDPTNIRGSLEAAGMWNAAPEQPSVDIFSGQGGQPAGTFQPPAASAINYGGFGSGAFTPPSFTPPRNIEGGTVGPRPPQGNFTAGRRRQKRGPRRGPGSGNGYSIGMVPGGR